MPAFTNRTGQCARRSTLLGDAPEEQPAEPAAAVSPHDDQVRPDLVGQPEDRLDGRAVAEDALDVDGRRDRPQSVQFRPRYRAGDPVVGWENDTVRDERGNRLQGVQADQPVPVLPGWSQRARTPGGWRRTDRSGEDGADARHGAIPSGWGLPQSSRSRPPPRPRHNRCRSQKTSDAANYRGGFGRSRRAVVTCPHTLVRIRSLGPSAPPSDGPGSTTRPARGRPARAGEPRAQGARGFLSIVSGGLASSA